MKTVFSNDELVHVWARQGQDHGRNSNGSMFFNNGVIYSYGDHFPMAKHIDLNRVLTTTQTYSVTTAGHLSRMHRAINHKEAIAVDNVLARTTAEHKANLAGMLRDIRDLANQHKRSRKYKDSIEGQIRSRIRDMNLYREWFKCGNITKAIRVVCDWGKLPSETRNSEDGTRGLFQLLGEQFKAADEADKKAEARRKAAEKKAKAERIAQLQEAYAEWKDGANHPAYKFRELPVAVRIDPTDPEIVQTSQGAAVGLKEAIVLYKAVKAGKDIPETINGYGPIRANSTTLRVGCHSIPVAELDRLHATLPV